MDPDEVTRLVNELKLSKPPDSEKILTIDSDSLKIGEQRLENCLVAKVLSPKAVNLEVFKQQMPRILQTTRQIEIGSMGDRQYLHLGF